MLLAGRETLIAPLAQPLAAALCKLCTNSSLCSFAPSSRPLHSIACTLLRSAYIFFRRRPRTGRVHRCSLLFPALRSCELT